MAAGKARATSAKFKAYVELMVAQEKFRPAEGSDHRWHVESENGGEAYTTTVTDKSVFCTCKGHNVAKGNDCKHIRLIRFITGILSFAAAKKSIIDEITGTKCPDCKKADYHEQAAPYAEARPAQRCRYFGHFMRRRRARGCEFGKQACKPNTADANPLRRRPCLFVIKDASRPLPPAPHLHARHNGIALPEIHSMKRCAKTGASLRPFMRAIRTAPRSARPPITAPTSAPSGSPRPACDGTASSQPGPRSRSNKSGRRMPDAAISADAPDTGASARAICPWRRPSGSPACRTRAAPS